MATSIDQQFVEFIVKSLVNNPEAVSIERRIDEKGVLLELTVDAEDLGRVIGKRGATAQSLRTLLRALGTKNEARYNLKIVDVDRPESERGVSAAALSSQDDTTDDADDSVAPATSDDDDEEQTKTATRESDTVSRTRKELADLDDLDI
ncbi:MAG TPA: KH domain-containing protein [Candidatus Saccharimonadales bacterium]|nr:KH domain-containing protein [Candidatus Saccharimonadales bacterium]